MTDDRLLRLLSRPFRAYVATGREQGSPEQRALFDMVQAFAVEWADGGATQSAVAPPAYDVAVGDGPAWSLGAHLLFVTSGGQSGVLADGAMAERVADLFRAIAGRQLAERYVAETGADPVAILAAADASMDDDASAPVLNAIRWLWDHAGVRQAGDEAEAQHLMLLVWPAIAHAFHGIAFDRERARADAAEAEAEGERKAREAAEQRARAAAETLAHDRFPFPVAIRDGWRADRYPSLLSRVEQGKVLALDDGRALLAQAVTNVSGREFADLTVPQIRVLVAVCSFMSDTLDDKGEPARLAAEHITFTARDLYIQAGIDPRQTKLCRDVVPALISLGDRRMYMSLVGRNEHGEREMAIAESEMFKVTPRWKDGDAELFEEWTAWRKRQREAGIKADGKWTGKLPSSYTISVPLLARQLAGALYVSRDMLERLDAGAKAVRGRGGKLTPLDFALFMEATMTQQWQQTAFEYDDQGDAHLTTWCYIEREKFIRDYLGDDAWQHDRKRCVEMYKTSAKLLEAGQLTLKTELDHKGRNGVRDKIALHPDVLHGVSKRAERANLAASARQLVAGERAKRAARGGKKRPSRKAP